MWMKNSATSREETGPLFSVGMRAFLQQNKKGCLFQQQPSILEANLMERDKISLSSHHFRQVNSSSGDIYHQTYCFAATEGKEEGEISQKASQNKLSYPPSSPKSGKMHCNNSILFIISGLVSLCSQDKELSIMASVCDLRIPLWPNTICSPFTSNSTQKQCQGTNFLLPS